MFWQRTLHAAQRKSHRSFAHLKRSIFTDIVTIGRRLTANFARGTFISHSNRDERDKVITSVNRQYCDTIYGQQLIEPVRIF